VASVASSHHQESSTAQPVPDERDLSHEERSLARWMLMHGVPEGREFLDQLEGARVVARCPCGCASVDFGIAGEPPPSGGLRILGDFLYGEEADLAGAFIFERAGVLAGIEVYGLVAEAPRQLPEPDQLRPFDQPRAT
jgi:hypothetical protein